MPDSCLPHRDSAYPSDCEIREGYRSIARDKLQEGRPALERRVLLEKAKNIKILLLDVDGVLTDGTLLYSSTGVESKPFHTQDGFGLRLIQEAGIEVGLITTRNSEAVASRSRELNLRYLCQGVDNKLEAFRKIIGESGCSPFEIAYMGDDWLDLSLILRAGLTFAPANGVKEIREAVHHVTVRSGGQGAVREVCDLLLEGKGLFAELLQKYINK